MASSHLENSALVLSVQIVYTIFGLRFLHVSIHNSASVAILPTVEPDFLELVSGYLFGSAEIAGLVDLFFL